LIIFFEAFLLGLAYAMPLGPQNVFVIHSVLTNPWKQSWKVPSFVSLVDISLAMACFFGVGTLLKLSPWVEPALLAFGCVFLLWMGWKIIRSRHKVQVQSGQKTPLSSWKVLRAALVLTWLNPQALLDGTLLFGSYRATLGAEETIYFLAGISVASPLWFFLLSAFVSIWRTNSVEKLFWFVSWICGLGMILYALRLGVHLYERLVL
jgi:L-lysine exporter family protein LysE/ArgO